MAAAVEGRASSYPVHVDARTRPRTPRPPLDPDRPAAHGGAHQQPGPSRPGPTWRWTAGPVVAVVLGALAVLLGLSTAVSGGALLVGDSVVRQDGYLSAPAWQAESSGYAVVTGEAVLAGAWLDRGLGDVRLRAVGRDGPVFLGVATAQDAAAYLDGVERTVLTGPRSGRDLPGGAPAVPPEDAGIWVASASGAGVQVIESAPRPGTWVAVVMPTDGAPGVEAVVDAGATVPWLRTAGTVTLAIGATLGAAGALAVTLAVRAASPARR